MKSTYDILENLDPRSKIISFFSIILCLTMTPITRLKDFGLYFLLILAILSLSKVTSSQILKRVFIFIPFILFIAMFVPFLKGGDIYWSLKIGYWKLPITYEGIWAFLNIIIKSSLSILLLGIASSTTAFPDFLKGLEMLRMPHLLVMFLSFMYRYILALLDDAKGLMPARSFRYFGSRYKEPFRIIGYMIAVMFMKSFKRTERIYRATAVRRVSSGETPGTKRFRFSYVDFLFILGIILSLLIIVSGLIYKIEYSKMDNTHLWQTL
jgi:cobalt ECF transporter T component CbiQ